MTPKIEDAIIGVRACRNRCVVDFWSAHTSQIGYARVSIDGQSLAAQVAELKLAGCTEVLPGAAGLMSSALSGRRVRAR